LFWLGYHYREGKLFAIISIMVSWPILTCDKARGSNHTRSHMPGYVAKKQKVEPIAPEMHGRGWHALCICSSNLSDFFSQLQLIM
jgi:hypothetical protein